MAFKKNKIYVDSAKPSLISRIFSSFNKIHLVDKCLITLMLVLMTQSAYVLLSNGGNSDTAHPIDIIIRTAAASIFGYLLSANFAQRNSKPTPYSTATKPPPELTIKHSNKTDTSQNRIGFALSENDSPKKAQQLIKEPDMPKEESRNVISGLQIITAASIALFCLLSLILIRDLAVSGNVANPSATAVASQFRDFISGCVGFLIGCPTTRSNN